MRTARYLILSRDNNLPQKYTALGKILLREAFDFGWLARSLGCKTNDSAPSEAKKNGGLGEDPPGSTMPSILREFSASELGSPQLVGEPR
jgi:hypothetical protein